MRIFCFVVLLCFLPQAHADFRSKVFDTLPGGVADSTSRSAGWKGALKDGSRRIWDEGRWDVYFSGYARHMPFEYPKEDRRAYNERAWGLGLGKRLIDEHDNERIFYALVFRESHHRLQYNLGYAWVARWRFGEDFRLGAGYTLLVFGRSRYGLGNYIPTPGILPLVSAGTDRFTLFATYVPGVNPRKPDGHVLFIFGRIGF